MIKGFRLVNTKVICGVVIVFSMVFGFISYDASATVMSADDIGGFGIGALTRDTDQGLDFLDVTFSMNRSFNDVSGHFGVGGNFEGFRYATET